MTQSLSEDIHSRLWRILNQQLNVLEKLKDKQLLIDLEKVVLRSALKKMNSIIEKKDKKEALAFFPKLNSELMSIAKTGIIKKQNASRNVSRITKKINSL